MKQQTSPVVDGIGCVTQQPYSRRQFLTLLGGLACTPLLPGCSSHDLPVKIATHMWPGYEPLSLARSLGILDENLVTLVESQSGIDSISLLETGKIDGAGLTLDEVLRIREGGLPLSVLLICDISAGADMLLAKPDIQSLAELKGRRIAVEKIALGELMLYQVLQAAGLKREDVIPVPLIVEDQPAAWQRGEIDAAVTFEPAASQIKKLGGKLLFDSRQIPELIFDVIAVRTELLDSEHSAALHHLIAAHLQALKHLNTNPDDASYRMAQRFKLPPNEVLSTFKGLVLPDLENNRRLLDGATPTAIKSAQVVADTMLKAGMLPKQANLDGLFHAEFLPINTA